MIRKTLLTLAIASGLLAPAASLHAQAYPNRAIRFIVPYPPGGGADITCRMIAQKMQEIMGQNVIVENRPGASEIVGNEALARSAPDGYTVGFISNSLPINAVLQPKLPYDTERDFIPITRLVNVPLVMVVNPGIGVNSIKELVALAKAKPGTLNFGSSGVGNSIHLAVEQFNAAVGIKAVHVPFKTGNETDTAMIAGEVQYTIASLATSLPLIQAGRIKALAVTGEGRDPALPNVPNLSESGLPVRIPDQLFGMVGPANMPAPVTSKLLKAVADMQADPAFQESVRRTGGVPSLVHGEAFRNLALSDSQTWGDLIKRLGITLSS